MFGKTEIEQSLREVKMQYINNEFYIRNSKK